MDFIRIYKTVVPNAKRTLDSPVLLSDVYQQISNPELKEKFSKILHYSSLYFWDFGVKAARELKNGMSVSIICGNKKYDCQLVEIIDDLKGELGDIFGWVRQYQAPWKNVCALQILNSEHTTPQKITAIKNKTISINNTFWKVIDPELKSQTYSEGKNYDIKLTKHERNILARRACLAHYKPVCQICNFDFYITFGEIGKGYIHVHHKLPLAKIKENYQVDPVKDLIPVCPNCHAMLHIKQDKTISIAELKEIYSKNMKR